MATNTYVALDKVTVGTATPSVTFSSIPSTYTDLIVVVDATNSAGAGSNGWGTRLRFNGDTASNYSWTIVNGNGTTASSARGTSVTSVLAGWSNGGTSSSTQIIHVMNYANTTTYKTTIGRSANAVERTAGLVNLWRKTPEAITSITIFDEGSNNWQTGSTFSLYGVSAIGGVTPKATGGTVTSDATYWYHTFEMSGNFVPNQSLTCAAVVIGGGGAGGAGGGGGGGAGGYQYNSSVSVTAQSYPVTVGGGGAGYTGASSNVGGPNGSNSTFSGITANGGGGGGYYEGISGSSGASGGGGGGRASAAGGGAGGSATQGFAGGSAAITSNFASGGGGGASAVGGNASGTTAGNGGAGVVNPLSGSVVGQNVGGTYYLAGGGGGSVLGSGTAGTGGNGGGGNGWNASGTGYTPGLMNTGGGGGGSQNNTGQSGGSGVVIIRYAK